MNRLTNYLMRPVMGILSKTGADIHALQRPTMNLPMTLHNFSRRNFMTRRMSYKGIGRAVRYHRSRIMGY